VVVKGASEKHLRSRFSSEGEMRRSFLHLVLDGRGGVGRKRWWRGVTVLVESDCEERSPC
jgi:hypothetical protein